MVNTGLLSHLVQHLTPRTPAQLYTNLLIRPDMYDLDRENVVCVESLQGPAEANWLLRSLSSSISNPYAKVACIGCGDFCRIPSKDLIRHR